MNNNALHSCFHCEKLNKQQDSVQTLRVSFFEQLPFHSLFPFACLLSFVLVVGAFDVLFQSPFFAELFPADLALESLESSVNSSDVGPEVLTQTKILPTLSALVGLQFLVNCPDVSLQASSFSEIFLTLTALVRLQFLVNSLDVFLEV